MTKPTLCLDFDGVLHSFTSPWVSADVISDPPVEGAQEACQQYLEDFYVVVHSARCAHPDGVAAIEAWLKENKFPSRLHVREVKPSAKVYLDDRAITFRGKWPDVTVLLAFEPWNK